MSEIKNGIYEFTICGKNFGLLFSLNAMDEMQDKLGGFDMLPEVFNPKNKEWIKDTIWLFTLLINSAAELQDYLNGTETKKVTEHEIGMLVNTGNIDEVKNAIYAAFAIGTYAENEHNETEDTDTGEGEEKNLTGGQN